MNGLPVIFATIVYTREDVLTRLRQKQQHVNDKGETENSHNKSSIHSRLIENLLQVIGNWHRFKKPNIQTTGIALWVDKGVWSKHQRCEALARTSLASLSFSNQASASANGSRVFVGYPLTKNVGAFEMIKCDGEGFAFLSATFLGEEGRLKAGLRTLDFMPAGRSAGGAEVFNAYLASGQAEEPQGAWLEDA